MSDENPREIKVEKRNVSFFSRIKDFYFNQYKLLLIIPFILLLFGVISIGTKYASTGEFINKDVSLKGGVTLTITTDKIIDISELKQGLQKIFPDKNLDVRSIAKFGSQAGIIVVADISQEQSDLLIEKTGNLIGIKLSNKDYTIQVVGSSLGTSFFKEVIRALLIAFFFMGAVVFLYFGPNLKLKSIVSSLALIASIIIFSNSGTIMDIIAYIIGIALIYLFIRYSIPSFAVILAAFSDIIVTLAIVNLIGIKLSTAGIAAFLMLIGYSVDTDILLSTRVLKRKEGTVDDRILGALKTGITMTLTTLAALIVAFIFSESEVIKQIMTILLIGLFIDLINTWLQNAGILKLFIELKDKK